MELEKNMRQEGGRGDSEGGVRRKKVGGREEKI
jgi:hypothetical protein